MRKKNLIVIFFMAVNLLFAMHVNSKEIIINKEDLSKENLVVDILKLALSKSDPQATIGMVSEGLPQSRLEDEIKRGNVDLMWAGVDDHLESTLMAVRIPLFKGLLGHRIFIIRKDQQHIFNNVKNFSDLKKLTAGQGTQWGDTEILKGANIPVATTLKYHNLFAMLEGGRFDYFPRAIHEPWSEVASRPELNLVVEENIMLVYPFTMYFFVKKGNQELHDKLYNGLEMAIADGSFDELFYNNQQIKDAINKTNIKNRTVIRVPNAAMHPDTPLDRKEFWLDTNSL